MEKHPIDLFIKNEVKLLSNIQNYLNKLTENKYNSFSVDKNCNGNYLISVRINADLGIAKLHSISFLLSIADFYQKASGMKFDSLDEVMEQYIQEQIVDEILYIINGDTDCEIIEE